MSVESGFEAAAMAVLTRNEGWSQEQVSALVEEAWNDARSRKVHGVFDYYFVYGRRPEWSSAVRLPGRTRSEMKGSRFMSRQSSRGGIVSVLGFLAVTFYTSVKKPSEKLCYLVVFPLMYIPCLRVWHFSLLDLCENGFLYPVWIAIKYDR